VAAGAFVYPRNFRQVIQADTTCEDKSDDPPRRTLGLSLSASEIQNVIQKDRKKTRFLRGIKNAKSKKSRYG
jgi:hypothetical protein